MWNGHYDDLVPLSQLEVLSRIIEWRYSSGAVSECLGVDFRRSSGWIAVLFLMFARSLEVMMYNPYHSRFLNQVLSLKLDRECYRDVLPLIL